MYALTQSMAKEASAFLADGAFYRFAVVRQARRTATDVGEQVNAACVGASRVQSRPE